MHTPYRHARAIMSDEALVKLGAPDVVYIRPVAAADLRGDVEGLDQFPDDMQLYAVHAADGTRMAVMQDIETAFTTAREHEMQPVQVH